MDDMLDARGERHLELELERMLAVADPGLPQILAEQSRASAADLPIIVIDHERNSPAGRRLVLYPATQLILVEKIDRALEHSQNQKLRYGFGAGLNGNMAGKSM